MPQAEVTWAPHPFALRCTCGVINTGELATAVGTVSCTCGKVWKITGDTLRQEAEDVTPEPVVALDIPAPAGTTVEAPE